MLLQFTIYFLLSLKFTFAKILPCKDSIESKVCALVDNANEYIPTNNPENPTIVNISVSIDDIMVVDEKHQTVQLLLRTKLYWYDRRLHVNRTKTDQEK